MAEKIAIVSDFDNTISIYDVCVGIFDAFSWPNWRELEKETMRCGKGSQTVLPVLLAPLEMPAHEFSEFILSQFEIDPYFPEFVQNCQSRNWPLFVLSDGLDFYIKLLFARAKLAHLNYRANHLEWVGNKPFVEFPFANPACGRCGNCKKSFVERIKRRGFKVVYIGDGMTDFCPAQEADVIFAKDTLLAFCKNAGISCRTFDNFAALNKTIFSEFSTDIRGESTR